MPSFVKTPAMLLRRAYLTMHRRFNAHFRQFGATADQFVILTLLAVQKDLTQQEVVVLTSSDPNTISSILRRLEKKHLLTRRCDIRDKRALCLCLTSKGRALQRELAQSSAALHRFFGRTISGKHRSKVLDTWRRISEATKSVKSLEIACSQEK